MYQVTEMLNKKIHQIIQNDLMFYLITVMIVIMLKETKRVYEDQGWPWARARWATALGLTLKLGLI
jgi:hypothetical protein